MFLMAVLSLSPARTAADGHASKGNPSKDNRSASRPVDFITRVSLGIQPLDGKKAHDFALRDLAGNAVRMSDSGGKVVFLNFWATWCPACRVEMPAMEKVHRRFKARGLAVVSVAVDAQGKKSVSPFVKELGLTFSVLLDPKNEVMDRYGVTLIPTTFLIGRSGELLGKVIGPKEWDAKQATRLFEDLLKATQGPLSREFGARVRE